GGRPGYTPCPPGEVEREMAAARAAGATLLLLGDKGYPPLLAELEPAPPALWSIGDPAIFARPAVAVVGARNASALGLRTARRLARELAAQGYVVVSGLARGIDAAAHEASLATGTIAVLAGGLDHPYPPENVELSRRVAGQGALVSEAPFGTVATAHHFPRRNRLVSGLARGVVLIEAAARSGSLITARFALDQGREAMACPGAPEDPRSAGCNQLIREGAALIRHAGDVEEALAAPRTLQLSEGGVEFDFDADLFVDEALAADFDALEDFETEGGADGDALAERIVALLGPSPVETDELARACGATPAEMSLALLELELAGRIELRPGGAVTLAVAAD
ncbi:MAG TPA: DNA-processing protein DprA, partial [Paracoccaceae bacterium]|nr:DNA-processing protein DprA [Paracoccaceae bacterium]